MIVDHNYQYLYGCSNSLVLNLIKSRLNKAGLDYQVHGEQISSLYPIPSLEARIYVLQRDWGAAKSLLEEIIQSLNEEKPEGDYTEIGPTGIIQEMQWEKPANYHLGFLKNLKLILIVLLIVSFIVILSL